MEDLTHKQADVLAYLWKFYHENDQLPTMEKISDHFGWYSNNSALTHMQTLERKGYIEHNALGKYRFKREGRAA